MDQQSFLLKSKQEVFYAKIHVARQTNTINLKAKREQQSAPYLCSEEP